MLDIKQLRLKMRLSQAELAEKTGIPKGRINNWEQGKGQPKAKDLDILRSFFEIAESKSIPRGTLPEIADNRPYNDIIKDLLDRIEGYKEVIKAHVNNIQDLREYTHVLKDRITQLEKERDELKKRVPAK